jgi:biotin operon repressor
VLRKGDIKMIKKLLEKGFSKSAVAKKLGISRDTVWNDPKMIDTFLFS